MSVRPAVVFDLCDLSVDRFGSQQSCRFTAKVRVAGRVVATAAGVGDGSPVLLTWLEGELPVLQAGQVEQRVEDEVTRSEFNRLLHTHHCVIDEERVLWAQPAVAQRLARRPGARLMNMKIPDQVEEAWRYFTKCRARQK